MEVVKNLLSTVKDAVKALDSSRVLACESVLAYGFSCVDKNTSLQAVRGQLSDIAGQLVAESKIQPALLAKAREFLEAIHVELVALPLETTADLNM